MVPVLELTNKPFVLLPQLVIKSQFITAWLTLIPYIRSIRNINFKTRRSWLLCINLDSIYLQLIYERCGFLLGDIFTFASERHFIVIKIGFLLKQIKFHKGARKTLCVLLSTMFFYLYCPIMGWGKNLFNYIICFIPLYNIIKLCSKSRQFRENHQLGTESL